MNLYNKLGYKILVSTAYLVTLFVFCWELCGNTKVLIVLLTYYVVVSTWKTTLVLK